MQRLAEVAKPLGLPEPLDARDLLKRNPSGRTWKLRNKHKLKGLVWHQELSWGSIEAVAQYHSGPDSHLYKGGVESIAYSWGIRKDGQVVLCNDLDKAVWSQGYKGRTGDENAEFMSVMFEGFFKGAHVTDPSAGQPNSLQMLSGLVLWHISREVWCWNDDDLYGHYLFGKPACPGNALETIIEAVRFNAKKPAFDLSTVTGRQEALNALGYSPGPVDGSWGPASRGALLRFQSDHKLDADGIWGTKTQAAVIMRLKTQQASGRFITS